MVLMSSLRTTCSGILLSILLIGLVTHRFIKCKKCNKVTSHRYDLITGRWECMICGELREEPELEDHSPAHSPESMSDLIRAVIALVLMFAVAYILMFYVIPLTR